MHSVYCITTQDAARRRYVGVSNDVPKRMREHGKSECNPALREAMHDYGWEVEILSVFAERQDAYDEEIWRIAEWGLFDDLTRGFNRDPGGGGFDSETARKGGLASAARLAAMPPAERAEYERKRGQSIRDACARRTPEQRKTHGRRIRESQANLPEEMLRKRGRKGAAALNAKLTLEQRQENGRKAAAATAEWRRQNLEQARENGRKAAAAMHASTTSEQRREWGRKGMAAMHASTTSEQRRETSRKAGLVSAAKVAAMTPDERAEFLRKRGERISLGKSRRKASMTAEEIEAERAAQSERQKARLADPRNHPLWRTDLSTEAMAADRARGMSYAAIGRKHGCSEATVRRLRKACEQLPLPL